MLRVTAHGIRRLTAALLLAGAARVTQAQVLRGTVHDAASGLVVPGAVVSVLDSARRVAGRTITDAQGRFAFSLRFPVLVLRVVRIGFRPRELPAPPWSPVADAKLDVTLEQLPLFMSAVQINGAQRCPRRDDSQRALAAWEQARMALLATIVAREARPGNVRTSVFERRLDASGKRWLWQKVTRREGMATRPFVAAYGAEHFAEHGYAETQSDSSRVYFAPDADVLLDESFAASHCFRLANDTAQHAGQVGIAFSPLPDRDTIVDVEGTAWMETSPPALRSLEFQYTSIGLAARGVRMGGALAFVSLDNGTLLIADWKIRMAQLGVRAERVTRGRLDGIAQASNSGTIVLGVHESGAVLSTADFEDGATYVAPLASLSGVVVSAKTHKPVADARVWMDSTSDTTFTDSLGRFGFEELITGPYTLRVADTTLDAVGLRASAETRFEIRGAERVERTITLQAGADIVLERCEAPQDPTYDGVLVVRARLPDGKAARGATVAVHWVGPGAVSLHRTGPTNDGGYYFACGLPRGQGMVFDVTVEQTGFKVGHAIATLPGPGKARGIVVDLRQPD